MTADAIPLAVMLLCAWKLRRDHRTAAWIIYGCAAVLFGAVLAAGGGA